jgi:hypothetical protein
MDASPGGEQPGSVYATVSAGRETAEGLIAIGVRLRERRAEVERRAEALNRAAELQLTEAAHASIQRVIEVATDAFAQWLSGHGEAAARQAGDEAATIFGQLAIQREVPLYELTKRILRWRDAVSSVLDEIADELHASRQVHRQHGLTHSSLASKDHDFVFHVLEVFLDEAQNPLFHEIFSVRKCAFEISFTVFALPVTAFGDIELFEFSFETHRNMTS